MLDLMAVGSVQGDGLPLYIYTIIRILREMRVTQQVSGGSFDYRLFKQKMDSLQLVKGQNGPLDQRIDILESFMDKGQTYAFASKKARNKSKSRNIWKPVVRIPRKLHLLNLDLTSVQAGQLTIVDLSCPCITADTACALFNICLSLFLEQDNTIGRVIALDEAHKYMTDSVEAKELTQSLLSTIRLQRHVAARIFVSTQEPTISPALLDLCSVTIVHRFSSPAWLSVLKSHLAGASTLVESRRVDQNTSTVLDNTDSMGTSSLNGGMSTAAKIFNRIVSLHTGEALLFSPSAAIRLVEADTLETCEQGLERLRILPDGDGVAAQNQQSGLVARLGHGVLKVRVRNRVTKDGGESVMAA